MGSTLNQWMVEVFWTVIEVPSESVQPTLAFCLAET